jgi:hypothetical protein
MRLRPVVLASLVSVVSCSRFGAVYPPRPAPSTGAPVTDPTPSRVVAHVAVTSAALQSALDEAIPKTGDGTFPLLGTQRRYAWDRAALDVSFASGHLVIVARVHANVAMPVGSLDFPLELKIQAEPVINTEYAVKMQSTDVKVTSTDMRLKAADHVAGVFEKIAGQIAIKLREFAYDLRPLLSEAHARVAKPIEFPVGDTKACVVLKVLGVEAGPTVLADGVEKDLALVVAPSVTMPCPDAIEPAPLPPLSNVATITPGPFMVTIPIAARYDELTRAMTATFTDGKLFFSQEYPRLFLEKPELYESQGQIVLKLHLQGPVHKFGIDADLDGDLFLSGHPAVVDNELRIPDLDTTIETKNFLLSLKAMTDGDRIRDQAREALRLDIGERLRSVRAKLGSDLTFGRPSACFKGDVDKVEVTGVYAHAAYLRAYVTVTARARAMLPCPFDPTPAAAPEEKASTP